jgi:hypothetical protein
LVSMSKHIVLYNKDWPVKIYLIEIAQILKTGKY